MKTELKAWLIDNTVTTDNKEDRILMLESAGTLTLADLLEEMKREDTGLRQETLEHVVNLMLRTTERLVLNGYSVNTGLFRAVAQLTGVVEGGQWDSKKNAIYISFTQGSELRKAIAETSVKILGEKGSAIYITGTEDTATRATDTTATAGRNFTLTGHCIKLAGDDPSVGITLKDSKEVVTKIEKDYIAVNDPSRLIFLLPAGLADGDYLLTVTTQFSSGNKLLKAPRSVRKTITIGSNSSGGEGEGEDPSV